MSLFQKYLGSASVALVSKAVNVLSIFGVLWLQNAIMGKDSFGLFMMAFSLAFALGMVIAAGLQALMMYHVSRKYVDVPQEAVVIGGQIFWLSVLVSFIVAGAVYGGAGFLAQLIGHDAFAPWLRDMAFFIPAHATAIVLPGYFRACQRVKETLFFQEILLNSLRVLFVGLIWIYALPERMVSLAYIMSASLPVLILFLRAPLWPSFKGLILTRWDLSYVWKIMTFQILNQPFRGVDVLLVGVFSTAGVVADYTMATRLAQLLWIPKHALAQLQIPRMGELLEKKDKALLQVEFHAMRCVSLVAVLLGCAFLLVFGRPILSLFGEYDSALPVLYILAAASIIRTGFGASGDLIGMAGHAGASAIIAAISMVITVSGIAILVPYMGATGGAFAVLLGTLQMFAGFNFVLKRQEELRLMPVLMWGVCMLSVIVLVLSAYWLPLALWCGLLMIGVAIIVSFLDKSWLRFLKHVK